MNVCRHIMEFFLFRWLFGTHEDAGSVEPHRDGKRHCGHNYTHDGCGCGRYTQSYDDFLDEQEEYDMMDDM